jgi:hypothetical protein
MGSLEFKLYRDNYASIQDLSNGLDISDVKWNVIFDALLKDCSVIYFYGFRIDYADSDFENAVLSLAEEFFIDDGAPHFRLLFRLNPIAMMFNRKQLSKLWKYYEDPAIIFLQDGNEETKLFETLLDSHYYSDLIREVKSIMLVYSGVQQNVLWLESSWGLDLPIRSLD